MCHECDSPDTIYNDGGRELCEDCFIKNIKKRNLGNIRVSEKGDNSKKDEEVLK